jgi:hypothetical protein
MTMPVAEGSSETTVPSTVIAGPPGDSVWPATMYCDAEFAVTVEAPMVKGTRMGPSVIWELGVSTEEGVRGMVRGAAGAVPGPDPAVPIPVPVPGLFAVPGTASTISVLPALVWMTRGVLSTVMVWPAVTVVEPPDVPITKLLPLVSWLTMTCDGPTVMVA